jgi:6-pyruvoyl-tetrahydropterin synthase
MKVTISRKAHFNGSQITTIGHGNKTMRFFCNPNFHGHNYELIVSVTRLIPKQDMLWM